MPTARRLAGLLIALRLPIAAMAVIVLASNVLVLFPFAPLGLGDYLTWGAWTYPFAFLIIDLSNRHFGAAMTRKVVYAGFVFGILLSGAFALPMIGYTTARIAFASGAAFLTAQLLDVSIFDRLRRMPWWIAPLYSSTVSSALDTTLFFTLAFAGDPSMADPVPFLGFSMPLWQSLAVCDFLVKLSMTFLFLAPYGALLKRISPASLSSSGT